MYLSAGHGAQAAQVHGALRNKQSFSTMLQSGEKSKTKEAMEGHFSTCQFHLQLHAVNLGCVSAAFFSVLSHVRLIEQILFYFNQCICLYRMCNRWSYTSNCDVYFLPIYTCKYVIVYWAVTAVKCFLSAQQCCGWMDTDRTLTADESLLDQCK